MTSDSGIELCTKYCKASSLKILSIELSMKLINIEFTDMGQRGNLLVLYMELHPHHKIKHIPKSRYWGIR